MKILLYFIILLSTINIYPQKKVSVIDISTKTPIPYANIKILNSTKGYYSNSKGIFLINDILNRNDTIMVSCLGYFSVKESVKNINDTITLLPKIETLNEVIVKRKKIKFKKLGFKRKNMTFFTGANLQLALFIKPKKEDVQSYIEEIIIPVNKSNSYLQNKNLKKKFSSILKISLFTNQSNLPYESLTEAPIIINYDEKSKKNITLDLSEYSISFKKNGIFICIEVIGEIDHNGNVLQLKNPRPGLIVTDKQTTHFNIFKTYYKTKHNNRWLEFNKNDFLMKKDIYLALQIVLSKDEE